MAFKQAPRTPIDGPMGVNRIDNDTLVVNVTHNGEEQSLVMSEHNAARVFGGLALMLGITLPSTLGKAIKF